MRVKWVKWVKWVRVQTFAVQGNLGAVYYNFPHAGAVSGFFDGPAGLPILGVNIELNIEQNIDICSLQANKNERVFEFGDFFYYFFIIFPSFVFPSILSARASLRQLAAREPHAPVLQSSTLLHETWRSCQGWTFETIWNNEKRGDQVDQDIENREKHQDHKGFVASTCKHENKLAKGTVDSFVGRILSQRLYNLLMNITGFS